MEVKRKFTLEGALHLYSGGASVLRPCDIYKLDDDERIRKIFEGCNIYAITRRKKIAICTHSLRLVNGLLFGNFLVHDGLDLDRIPFSQENYLLTPKGALFAVSVEALDIHGKRSMMPRLVRERFRWLNLGYANSTATALQPRPPSSPAASCA